MYNLFKFMPIYIAYLQLPPVTQRNSNRGLVLLLDILHPMVFLHVYAESSLALASLIILFLSGEWTLALSVRRFRRGGFMILGRFPRDLLSVNRVDKVSPSVIGA